MTRHDLRARRSVRQGLAVCVAAIVASVGFGAPPALADDGSTGATNLVQVTNQRDGSWKTRAKTMVAQEPGPSITDENVALARASCTDCRTVAVAVQAVIVEGPVDDFRPGNAAVAVNENCLRCATFAYARQEVLYADGPVRLSDWGENRIAEIRGEAKAIADSDEPFDQMITDLDALTAELVSVLQGEIDGTGAHTVDEHSDRRVEREED